MTGTVACLIFISVLGLLAFFLNDVPYSKTQEDVTMAIATVAMREKLAVAYRTAAPYAGLATTAAAGTLGTEVTGTGYARQTIVWTDGAVDGSVTGTATFTVPPNVTVQSAFLIDNVTVGSGTFLDSVAVSYAAQTSSGTLTINFTYNQT